jgi:hypothetical protein
MIKYTFWANSVKGLLFDKDIYAPSYIEAKKKIIRFIVRGSPVRRVP